MALPIVVAAALKAAVTTALTKKLGKAVTDKLGGSVIADVVAEVSKDPVVINEISAEKPYQSRVAVGSVVAALGVVAPLVLRIFGVEVSEADVIEVGGALVTLGGAAFALYGRFVPGLKPLFSKA